MFNMITCGIAIIVGGLWFWCSYRIAKKNEELEYAMREINLLLAINQTEKAKEITIKYGKVDFNLEVEE